MAALLHYCVLAAFCFSLGIAWQHFMKLTEVFKHPANNNTTAANNSSITKSTSLSIIKWYVFATVYPAGFAIYGFLHRHGQSLPQQTLPAHITIKQHCWLPTPDLYFLFVAPLTALLAASLLIYVIVVIKVTTVYNYTFCLRLRRALSKKSAANTAASTTALRRPRCYDNDDEFNYTNQRVVILLAFSFVSLGLAWLLGLLVLVSARLPTPLKMLADFLFCACNSFHGVSLLIGNWLARKYSKPGPVSTSTFTKTALISGDSPAAASQLQSSEMNMLRTEKPLVIAPPELDELTPSMKRRLSLSSRFYLGFYGVFFSCCKEPVDSQRPGVHLQNAGGAGAAAAGLAGQGSGAQRRQKSAAAALRRTNMLEFSIANYESSDSNPNGHTISSHVTGGHSFCYSEIGPQTAVNNNGGGSSSAKSSGEPSVVSGGRSQVVKNSGEDPPENVYQTSAF
jgi:hypothetical protein